METVERNAKEAFARHRVKRASDLTARSLALAELQEALELPDAPLRIECIDISHVQGTNVVASMVVFEDGLAKKSDYRRFSVTHGTDDTAAMAEVVRRRFARHLKEEAGPPRRAGGRRRGGPAAPVRLPAEPARGRRRRAPGGRGQPVARRSSASSTSPSAGWPSAWRRSGCPGDSDPVILPRTSEALYLLQRVRDEAHRFAITYHRQKRSTSMLVSLLDDVPGLGETRRKALMKQFGSLKRLRAATVEELMAVPGIGRRTAEAVQAAIAEPADAGRAAGDAGADRGVDDGAAGPGRARHAARRRRRDRRGRPGGLVTRRRTGTGDARAGPQSDVPPGPRPGDHRDRSRSRSSSSPGCPARARTAPAGCWRTSAGSSSTTCRRRCCSRWSSSAPAATSAGSPPSSTSAAGPSPATCRRRSGSSPRPGTGRGWSTCTPATRCWSAGTSPTAASTRCRATGR